MTDVYLVDRLVAERQTRSGRTEFRVRWVGYGPKDDTWEEASNITSGAAALINQLRGIPSVPQVVDWACCDLCGKWRRLVSGQRPPADDEPWHCALNQDVEHNSCAALEDTEEAATEEAKGGEAASGAALARTEASFASRRTAAATSAAATSDEDLPLSGRLLSAKRASAKPSATKPTSATPKHASQKSTIATLKASNAHGGGGRGDADDGGRGGGVAGGSAGGGVSSSRVGGHAKPSKPSKPSKRPDLAASSPRPRAGGSTYQPFQPTTLSRSASTPTGVAKAPLSRVTSLPAAVTPPLPATAAAASSREAVSASNAGIPLLTNYTWTPGVGAHTPTRGVAA